MISDTRNSRTWAQLLGLLREADLGELRSRLIDYPHPSLAVALGASVSMLDPETHDRYLPGPSSTARAPSRRLPCRSCGAWTSSTPPP